MFIINKFIIFIIFVTIYGTYGQEPDCLTPSYSRGKCILLPQCKPLFQLLQQPGISQNAAVAETLRKSICGVESTTPKVCCPVEQREVTTVQGSGSSVPEATLDRMLNFVPGPPNIKGHRNLRLVNENNCGSVTDTKIIGGNRTSVTEFPWMALIVYTVNKKYRNFACGGTLINKRYVLTAAHCVTELKTGVELAGVRLGDHNIGNEKDCDFSRTGLEIICADKYQNFFFENLHVHPGYRSNKLDNDIALIRLDGDANLKSNNVKPICLPIGDAATLRSKKVIVTGWGITENRIRSQELLKVRLELVTNTECDGVYQKSNDVRISYKQFCAGGKSLKDSCGGDSGGPAQLPDSVNNVPKYVQHGIVSFGTTGCGIEGFPGVYTKIVYYMDWILDNLRD